jgi:hypothetical protein
VKWGDNTFDYFDVSSGSDPSPGVAKSSDSGGAFNRTQVAISSDSGGAFNRTQVAVCVGLCSQQALAPKFPDGREPDPADGLMPGVIGITRPFAFFY